MRNTPPPAPRNQLDTLKAFTPFFRYSPSRDAYVLRVVGNRIGPVLRARRATENLHTPG
jgi:hypothetical protein